MIVLPPENPFRLNIIFPKRNFSFRIIVTFKTFPFQVVERCSQNQWPPRLKLVSKRVSTTLPRQSMEHRERETRTSNKQKTVNEPKMKKKKNGTVEEKLSPLCTRATPAEIKFVSLFSQLFFAVLSSHLVSSHLVSSRLVSSRLISSHLISSGGCALVDIHLERHFYRGNQPVLAEAAFGGNDSVFYPPVLLLQPPNRSSVAGFLRRAQP